MSTTAVITPIFDEARSLRRARGAFVKSRIEEDDRSARYVAGRIGINPSSMSERLRGKSPFLADELEGIALVLKIDPVEFYRDYIAVGPAGIEPTTSTVISGHLAPVTSILAARSLLSA